MSSSSSSSPSRRGGRRGDGQQSEGPSSSRQRWNNQVWPEPFLESLARRVAINASGAHGRLAAAPAISTLFQVCSTWQSISHSDHLWQTLTGHIWRRYRMQHGTWRDEYIIRHRTALNFRTRNAIYASLQFNLVEDEDADAALETLTCRRLALSDFHLACGLVDGSVRVFDLTSRLHVSTFRPHPRDRLGRFSRAVSGIAILEDDNFRLVFASVDGDVHVAISGNNGNVATRRVQLGNVVNDGTLVDFSGSSRRWWVGLYAGVPGRSFHVWNAVTEQLLYVGGSLSDPESVMGWHLLSEELNESIGRVRMCGDDSAVSLTSIRLISIDLSNDHPNGVLLRSNEEHLGDRGVIVDSVDVGHRSEDGEGLLVMVDDRGVGRVRRVSDHQVVCRFRLPRGRGRGGRGRGRVLGCINSGCVLIWSGSVIRAWEVEQGEFLYELTVADEGMGVATAMATDERHIAVASSDTTIHLWDFGGSV